MPLSRSASVLSWALLLSIPFVFVAPPAATAQPAAANPTAQQVAAQVMEALGGQQAWDGTHYLRFSFAGRRTHTWDKWTGRHRVEGQTKDGKSYVVLDNINTHQGRAWVGGKEATGDELAKMLELGYGTWVNDTYWLLMPYKMGDPGVHLDYAGEETIAGQPYDKLHLSFDKVGLTPGDQYWAYVNRNTHLMDRWAFHLESMKAEDPPSAWDWQGWQRYGKIELAPHRVEVGGDGKLELGDISVPDSVPDAVFTEPGAPPR